MNIDERIEALRVNIESLHSNLAHLVETTQATDGRIDRLTDNIDKLTGRVDTLTGHMTNLTVTMDRLANIVIRHEERLDSLDGSVE